MFLGGTLENRKQHASHGNLFKTNIPVCFLPTKYYKENCKYKLQVHETRNLPHGIFIVDHKTHCKYLVTLDLSPVC